MATHSREFGGIGAWGRPGRFALGAAVGGGITGIAAYIWYSVQHKRRVAIRDETQKFLPAPDAPTTAENARARANYDAANAVLNDETPITNILVASGLGLVVGGTVAALPAKRG